MVLVTTVMNYQEKLVGKPTIGIRYLVCTQHQLQCLTKFVLITDCRYIMYWVVA